MILKYLSDVIAIVILFNSPAFNIVLISISYSVYMRLRFNSNNNKISDNINYNDNNLLGLLLICKRQKTVISKEKIIN